jgi:conserved oligomeric Golgi complex subunit 3
MTLINAYPQRYISLVNSELMKAMNETTQSALLYAKFRSNSAPLKNVVREIEQRSHDHEEYASLLNECYQSYFGIRIRLITPIVMTRMAEISGSKDIVPYVIFPLYRFNSVSFGILVSSRCMCR